MNEINKIKAEHARYKEALETLASGRITIADARRVADCALNQPPPLPVTLEALQEAIIVAESRTQDFVAILLNKDGSGNFRLGPTEKLGVEFKNLQDALDLLISGQNLG